MQTRSKKVKESVHDSVRPTTTSVLTHHISSPHLSGSDVVPKRKANPFDAMDENETFSGADQPASQNSNKRLKPSASHEPIPIDLLTRLSQTTLYHRALLLKQKGDRKLLDLEIQLIDSKPALQPTRSHKQRLQEVLRWKLLRGTFRPTLPALLNQNSEELVKNVMEEAISQLKQCSDVEEALISGAIETMCKLKGVGPATGSGKYHATFIPWWLSFCLLLYCRSPELRAMRQLNLFEFVLPGKLTFNFLCCHRAQITSPPHGKAFLSLEAPTLIPFMSDEAAHYLQSDLGSIKYTLSFYKKYAKSINRKVIELNQLKPLDLPWDLRRAERAFWTLSVLQNGLEANEWNALIASGSDLVDGGNWTIGLWVSLYGIDCLTTGSSGPFKFAIVLSKIFMNLDKFFEFDMSISLRKYTVITLSEKLGQLNFFWKTFHGQLTVTRCQHYKVWAQAANPPIRLGAQSRHPVPIQSPPCCLTNLITNISARSISLSRNDVFSTPSWLHSFYLTHGHRLSNIGCNKVGVFLDACNDTMFVFCPLLPVKPQWRFLFHHRKLPPIISRKSSLIIHWLWCTFSLAPGLCCIISSVYCLYLKYHPKLPPIISSTSSLIIHWLM